MRFVSAKAATWTASLLLGKSLFVRGFDTSRQSAFLPPSECFKKHQEEGTRFVHASWYHKGNRSGRIEFEEGRRIPNSVYFDLDDVCDDSQRLAHMQPTRELFACAMDQLEIRNDDNVILYG
jgi:3-mercaptopyruvate sulfurtransferase SseA